MVPDNNATRSFSSTAGIRGHVANVDNIQEIDFHGHIYNPETYLNNQNIEREAGLPHTATVTNPATASSMFKHEGHSKVSGLEIPYKNSSFPFSAASETEDAVFSVADADGQWGHAFVSSHHPATDTADLYAMLPRNSLPPQPPALSYQYNGSSTASLASIQPLDGVIAVAAAVATASPLTAATTAATTVANAATIDWTPASCLAISATSNNTAIANYSFAHNAADNAAETNMMAGTTLLHDILPSHIYQTLQSAPRMDNFPSIDNLAAPFQSLEYYYRQQQQQSQQPRQQEQLQLRSQQIEQSGFSAEAQGSIAQIPSLMFDIPALNSAGSDVSSSTYSKSISIVPMGSPNNTGNYPLSFDTSTQQGSASFAGLNGTNSMDGIGQSTNINAEDAAAAAAAAMCAQNTGTGGIVSTRQLPLSRLPGGVNNASSFISSPLATPFASLSGTGAMQPQHLPVGVLSQPQIPPQQLGQNHPNMSQIPQGRPYNMMFGVPGLQEPPMIYDDRMSIPPMHHGGGWLRIKQPIDYVAPLKKPMNSFLLYSAERRVQLRQTHPDLNTTQQSTILAREWANLPEEEKEKYRAEAKQLRDDYNARRAELSLKLQQQLNQQHLGLGLGHPPPPPLPHPPHGSVRLQSQDLLGQAMSADSHLQMHSEGVFGLLQQQQSFAGSGMRLSHTQLPPPTPAVVTQNQQTTQDEAFQTQPATSTAADQLQFQTTLSTLDHAGGESNMHTQTLDFATNGLVSGIYGDKQGAYFGK
ncbi:hypothetical protein H4S08_004011 [Coemansia sp. RSA 1365]|nr:hypothetical protein H4S08_004011 [Coemansia sp. RSA 1365]